MPKSMTAGQFARAIMANVEEMYANIITYDEFDIMQRLLWAEVDLIGDRAAVNKILQNSPKGQDGEVL